MESYSIYSITNTVTGRVYVGRTTSPISRLHWHKTHLRNGGHNVPELQADWDLLGEDAFRFDIIEVLPDWEQAAITERRLIRRADNPYNRLGNPNYVHHHTVRAQMRKAA